MGMCHAVIKGTKLWTHQDATMTRRISRKERRGSRSEPPDYTTGLQDVGKTVHALGSARGHKHTEQELFLRIKSLQYEVLLLILLICGCESYIIIRCIFELPC